MLDLKGHDILYHSNVVTVYYQISLLQIHDHKCGESSFNLDGRVEGKWSKYIWKGVSLIGFQLVTV